MNPFKKLGNGFKWLGKKLLGAIRSDETLIVVKLAASFIPIPALDKIISLVWLLDHNNWDGWEKMEEAMDRAPEILEEYGIKLEEESDLRFILELCLKIAKGKARIVEV